MDPEDVEKQGRSRRRKREENQEGERGKIKKIDTESCLDDSANVSVHEVITFEPSTLPAHHYDPDTTEPISSSLKSLDELLSWKRSEANPFNLASVPLSNREPQFSDSRRRTLICHDMMGGYLEDRFIQGTEVGAPYVFYHWQYIDIFNYFSHHMVTIPPAMWTNTAHKHGVLSLGTFITEWMDGGKICEVFLAEEEVYRSVGDKLAQIAHCHGFDGWLINIENMLSEKAVKNMALFLRYLTDQLHERVPGSQVIWYDSVLENGALKWQNELNESNRVFFDACDGIFTNYNWTESSLEGMATYSVAQGRLADIYIGIDVFARGEVVGGKFETNKALQLVRKHGFSTAIFAPGWVYECHDKADFRNVQDKFWLLLEDQLYVHRPVSSLPFISSFCQGFGKSTYWRGQVEQERSWFNLSAQELQPMYFNKSLEDGGWWRTRGCSEDVWTGGSSLLLEGKLPKSVTKVLARIFSVQIPLASRTFISLVYKPSVGVKVSLELKTKDAGLCTLTGTEEIPTSSVFPVVLKEDHVLVKQFIQSCGQWSTDGWTIRCFLLELNGCALSEVCVCVTRDKEEQDVDFSCRIGEFMVLDAESLLSPPVPVRSVCVDDVVWHRTAGGGDTGSDGSLKMFLNATLRWSYPPLRVRFWRVYWRRLRGPDPRVPPGSLVLIGRSFSTLYRVTELEIADPSGLMELLLEPVTREGFTLAQSYWGRVTLSYTH
ncbi:cytosolic endo-beta-N-acetylglucosaminidase [Hoplias malabaricus]|uniref:cytosolic endo-beta-N-acetylglucosaminidase n=1 Tax=Hoplias malabaricus TaxID=27720 RepID=UPI003461F15A